MPFVNSLPPFIIEKIHNIIVENPKIVDEWIQPHYVIRKIKEEREDLYPVIQDPKYYKWLSKFINYVRKLLKTL